MCLIEDQRSVKLRTEPIDKLVQPRFLAFCCTLSQRRIGREHDAVSGLHILARFHTAQISDRDGFQPQTLELALSPVKELLVLRNQDMPFPALCPVVSDDCGDLRRFPDASAVSDVIALAVCPAVAFARQEFAVGLTGIDHLFKLGFGNKPLVHHLCRDLRGVVGHRRLNRGHGRGFDQQHRVLFGALHPHASGLVLRKSGIALFFEGLGFCRL